MKRDLDFIPRSYEEMYNHYFTGADSHVRMLMRGFLKHGTPDEFENLSQDIFLRAMDNKVIEGFNPEKANFGGVIFFVTRSVCVNYLNRKSRDPLGNLYGGSVTESAEEEEFTPGVYNLDRFFVGEAASDAIWEVREQVEWLFSFAKQALENPQNKRDRSLLPMLKMLAAQFTPSEVAEELKVTTTTVSNWMMYLQSALIAHAA